MFAVQLLEQMRLESRAFVEDIAQALGNKRYVHMYTYPPNTTPDYTCVGFDRGHFLCSFFSLLEGAMTL